MIWVKDLDFLLMALGSHRETEAHGLLVWNVHSATLMAQGSRWVLRN